MVLGVETLEFTLCELNLSQLTASLLPRAAALLADEGLQRLRGPAV